RDFHVTGVQTCALPIFDCLPPAHLRACFERLLQDIRANRAGMPDLIQFWPAERRYRMIEVKGPGDRLQDNQKRWLAFCATQGIRSEERRAGSECCSRGA